MIYKILGTKVGDRAECTAIAEFFCKNREEPLLIGSVKTNMGHAEISAGLTSILKVLAVLRTGIIPANLNSDPIDTTLPGIKDGKLKVSLNLLNNSSIYFLMNIFRCNRW